MTKATILFGLGLASGLWAQTPDTATLQGHVADQTHAPVSAVAILVKDAVSGIKRIATTDAEGNFTVAGLPVAPSYTLTADKPGFTPAKMNNITLGGGTTAEVNLELNVAGAGRPR